MANSTSPPRTVVITGISPLYSLSEDTAYSFATNGATHLALLGMADDYLQTVQSEIAAQFPHITVLAQPVDITSSESMGIASHRIRSTLGPWDVFVHNSSAHAERCPDTSIRHADEDRWWGSFERNVRSLHFVARHFFSKMKETATFVNIVRTDLDGGGIERDSAGNASGVAAAKVVEYLGEENEDDGLKVMCVIALPEDKNVGDFIVWTATQRVAFVHAMSLEASIGIRGYEVVEGKLRRRDVLDDDDLESEFRHGHTVNGGLQTKPFDAGMDGSMEDSELDGNKADGHMQNGT